MARFLSQTLLRHRLSTMSSFKCTAPLSPCVHLSNRHRSSQTTKPKLIEIDLSSSSSPSSSLADVEYEVALKKFDDLIQRILVKKATPDWLPFVPGSSFWVPPRLSPEKVVDLVEKMSDELSDEECLSLATLRGWPCSNFFIKEVKGSNDKEMKVEVKVVTISGMEDHSEDEEG